MKLRDCIFLLPNRELDAFPRTLPEREARELLSGWLALWHPQLIAAAAAPPRWQQADQLPHEPHDMLFVLPQFSESVLEIGGEERIVAAGGRLFRPHQAPAQSDSSNQQTLWREFQILLLQIAGDAGFFEPRQGHDQSARDESAAHAIEHASQDAQWHDWLHDFAALGYAFLQMQLMTRKLHTSSNLDLLLFGQQLTEAAQATLTGDRETAERMLQSCFDALGQERDHFFTLDVSLLDVTLLAETTLGKSLATELDCRRERPATPDNSATVSQTTSVSPATLPGRIAAPTTFLASGAILRKLREANPERLSDLQAAVDARRACIIGGLDVERPHPLMTRDSLARDMLRGREAYQACGLTPPRIFARNSFGLSPDSVAMLRRWGFDGCFLIAWSDGAYPHGKQAKISWEALDGTFMSAIAAPVLDAANPSSFLALGWTIGEMLDHQHVPTLLFAHWPNRRCEFAELLDIVTRRTPALGKWRLADEYFDETDQPYHQERLEASDFRCNWLLQADSPSELLLATQQFHLLQTRCRSLLNLMNVAWQLEKFQPNKTATAAASAPPAAAADPSRDTNATSDDGAQVAAPQPDPTQASYRVLRLSEWSQELSSLADRVDALLDAPHGYLENSLEARKLADSLQTTVLERLAKQLTGIRTYHRSAQASGEHQGRLLVNPRSAAARVVAHTPADQHFPSDSSWCFAEGRVGDERASCIDLPAIGFVVSPLRDASHSPPAKQRPLAAGETLCNEFLEAQIDSQRGHLRSLHIPAKRGNRLSLMIARRDLEQGAKEATYSEMVASDVRMLTSSNVCGLIRAVGRLELAGETVAKFQIDYETWRGSRIIEIAVRLQELAPLANANPWLSAYTLRIAWPTEAAILRTYARGTRQIWSGGRAVAPTLIEIDEVDYRTHFLTGGLAFHRRTEERFLETVLAVQGERETYHRFGVAVDLPHPILAAGQFLEQPYEIALDSPKPITINSGWFVSVNTRSVIVELEAPLVDEAGNLVGIRLFLTETDGKSTNAKLRLLHEIESANRVDYLGGKIGKLTSAGDSLTIAIRSYEQVNVDVLWKRTS